MKPKPTAVRLTNYQLAKARDGLINRGIKPENLTTRSSILRLAIFLAISEANNPNGPASDDSLAILDLI